MHLSAIARRTRRAVSQGESLPAPVLGWNARDPLDGMDPGYAVRLDNFFPRPGSVNLRRGYTSHATGVGTSSSNVETLATYDNNGTSRLLAAANGNIYNATNAGAASSLGSGFTNDRWQWVDFAAVTLFVNGADTMQTFDGTTLTNGAYTGSGFTSSSMIGIHAFKNRVFLIQKDSAKYWYGGVDATSGAVSSVDLAGVHPRGGDLIAIATLTIDGGQGIDDLIAFLMESGAVLVYSGTDPGDANNWSLVGRFEIAPPVGRRPVIETGPDAAVITADGYIPLLPFLKAGRIANPSYAISDNIQRAVNDAVRSYSSNFGWQALLYPKANMVIFNVPKSEGVNYEQHVLNSQTGAWCRFTGVPAVSWVVFQENAYFGGVDGTVYKFDNGLSDGGTPIAGDAQTAFHYIGGRGRLKNFHLYRPILDTDGQVPVSVGLGVDYDQDVTVTALASVVSAGADWDTATWDVDEWTQGTKRQREWRSAATFGYSASMRLKVLTGSQTVKWYSTDFVFEKGGML